MEPKELVIGGYRVLCTPLTVGDVLNSEADQFAFKFNLMRAALRRIEQVTDPEGNLLGAKDMPAAVMNHWISMMQ